MIQFNHIVTPDDDFIVAFIPGENPLGPAPSSHPNFKRIVQVAAEKLQGIEPDADEVRDLFDIPAAVKRAFARLSERVTVEGQTVKIDGDPVDNTLAEQILAFMDEGEDFAPLVNFYEKLLTNPLGQVQAGLYDWIRGQTADGDKVTITAEGDLVGYKGVWPVEGKDGVYKPSSRGRAGTVQGIVNGVEVPGGSAYIEQSVGDVVEMPRMTLSEPSAVCGVGLHVGTWDYAKTFGPVCLVVKFSPRDVVSAPDANSSWKLRVCRYTVLGLAENQPVQSSLLHEQSADLYEDCEDFGDPDFDLS